MGSPLGLDESPSFGFNRFQIETQDILLLITDGVIEQKDFSFVKLSRMLKKSANVSDIYNELFNTMNLNKNPQDDITWLLMQWRGDVMS